MLLPTLGTVINLQLRRTISNTTIRMVSATSAAEFVSKVVALQPTLAGTTDKDKTAILKAVDGVSTLAKDLKVCARRAACGVLVE
jgi:hypothetical protein